MHVRPQRLQSAVRADALQGQKSVEAHVAIFIVQQRSQRVYGRRGGRANLGQRQLRCAARVRPGLSVPLPSEQPYPRRRCDGAQRFGGVATNPHLPVLQAAAQMGRGRSSGVPLLPNASAAAERTRQSGSRSASTVLPPRTRPAQPEHAPRSARPGCRPADRPACWNRASLKPRACRRRAASSSGNGRA